MKLEKLPWSGIGEDPNKVRQRKILTDLVRRQAASARYVIEMASEVTGTRKKAKSWYNATDAIFTSEPSKITLFLDREVANAALIAFVSKTIRVVRCQTKIVKGHRVAILSD